MIRKIKNALKRRIQIDKVKIIFKNEFKTKNKKILLIPPTFLNGSFGDELMVVAFLNQFNNDVVDLFENKIKIRNDLFSNFKLNYVPWSKKVNFKDYKSIYILGADNMTGAYNTEHPLFKLDILNHGNQLNLKTAILGFSVNENMNEKIIQKMQSLLPKTQYYLREPVSYGRAEKFLPNDNIKQVADLAFLCPSHENHDSKYLNWISKIKANQKIIAVCPNAIQAQHVGLEKYINDLIFLLTSASKNENVAFVFLYHDIRIQCNEKYSDLHLSQMLYEKLKNISPSFFTPNIKNGVELKSYLKHVHITFTGRMHFGISGYSLKKPMFGLAYEGKFSGLQKLFGINPHGSLVSDLNEIQNYSEQFSNFITNYEENKKLIDSNYDKVIEFSLQNFM